MMYLSLKDLSLSRTRKECQIPKLMSQRKSKCRNAKTGTFWTLLLPVGESFFGALDFELDLAYGF